MSLIDANKANDNNFLRKTELRYVRCVCLCFDFSHSQNFRSKNSFNSSLNSEQ